LEQKRDDDLKPEDIKFPPNLLELEPTPYERVSSSNPPRDKKLREKICFPHCRFASPRLLLKLFQSTNIHHNYNNEIQIGRKETVQQ